MSRAFDVILFGATGYTGEFVIRELALLNKTNGWNGTWAVAGRSQAKLSKVLGNISKELGDGLDLEKTIKSVIVDINDQASIKAMCEQAKLIINCVGPYRFYGENVVKECVAAGTCHVDISGEPEYMETMQLKYNKQAEENNCFIVSACGFDSVPADLGIVYMRNQFKNDINHVESYLSFASENGEPFNCNFGTYESAVYGVSSAMKLGPLRKQLFPTRLPKSAHPAPKRPKTYFYDEELKQYCFNFLGSDKSVVQRTQYFNWDNLDQRPVVYNPFFMVPSFIHALGVMFFGAMFGVLAMFPFGRTLLLKYYTFFSAGMATKKQSTIEEMKGISFKFLFRGYGYSKKLADKHEQFEESPKQQIVTEVTGPEPGYIATSQMLTTCAMIILEEKDKIPVKGGVLTPASAFANSTLIERLNARYGIKFRVIRNDAPADKL